MPNHSPLKLAVVTGGHPFDVPAFEHVFRAMKSVDFYVQSLDDFTCFPKAAAQYDVVLFYTMHCFKPGDALPWFQKNVFSTLEQLGTTSQGIVVLHHALLAFPDWPLWRELTGLYDISFGYENGQSVTSFPKPHVITKGTDAWTMTDEIYTMSDAKPADGNEILLTTDHPRSTKALGWTRQFRQSRVFCYQPGHDARAFENENYRRILERGILWSAGQI